ncbi:RNA-guided endonuclease InsQ/TnpB family protein [Baaleninema sp.]|uniref:RNA-guided endonuclease InsQ/TnpB family protein n=2 Tax=Baaleninema sp. TaxID=3101197 RepID=UPI003D064C4D
MFVLEYKVKPKPYQVEAIEEAIRMTQFVRNKVLRYWMDNRGVGKAELFRYNTRLRKEFKFVEELNSHACQTAVERTLRAITRFYENCKKQVKGKKRCDPAPSHGARERAPREGYPQFKRNTRSVEYKVSGWKLSEDRKHIVFTDKKGIGHLRLIGSRDLNYYHPEQIKRVRILKRADGYYVQFCIKLDPRLTVSKPLTPSQKAVGIDVGLKYFLADSQGNIEPIPQFYRKAEKRLNRLNRQKSKKFRKGKPQSRNYRKARQRYARQHLRVSRQREEFVKRVALRIPPSPPFQRGVGGDLVAYEDLNVAGLVKNRHPPFAPLSKGGWGDDAGWALFRRWLDYFADKYGKIAIAVPPHNTSQNCSSCGEKVQKSLSTRTHICPHCGFVADRDTNAAINILKLGLSRVGRTRIHASGEIPSWLAGEILSANGDS